MFLPERSGKFWAIRRKAAGAMTGRLPLTGRLSVGAALAGLSAKWALTSS